MPQKFRKKPVVVVEAMQFDGRLFSARQIQSWVNGSLRVDWVEGGDTSATEIYIHTLEGGVMTASPGDWVIKGVKGEFYPCKPDIFDATYEPVS